MNKRRVLITGGAGYIGSVMVPTLLNLGYKVTVIDNFRYNQLSLLENAYSTDLKVIKQNIESGDIFKNEIKKNDIIIPLAAIVGAPACNKNTELTRKINKDQIDILVKNISRNQKIIFPVTNSGYGIGKKDIYCDETSPLNPISLYAKTKVEAEKILLDYGNCVCFRLATVFGTSSRMRMDLLVNDFVYRAYKDKFIVLFEPNFKRNYIHIRDVAEAFVFAINNYDKLKGETFNLGLSDANLSKKELCQRIQKYQNNFTFFESDLDADPDKRDYIVSNKKIEERGWKSNYSLDYGINELLEFYKWFNPEKFNNL